MLEAQGNWWSSSGADIIAGLVGTVGGLNAEFLNQCFSSAAYLVLEIWLGLGAPVQSAVICWAVLYKLLFITFSTTLGHPHLFSRFSIIPLHFHQLLKIPSKRSLSLFILTGSNSNFGVHSEGGAAF